MNGAMVENPETEKRIKEYIQASSMSLSKKEEQDFKQLVIHNEETAKKVTNIYDKNFDNRVRKIECNIGKLITEIRCMIQS